MLLLAWSTEVGSALTQASLRRRGAAVEEITAPPPFSIPPGDSALRSNRGCWERET